MRGLLCRSFSHIIAFLCPLLFALGFQLSRSPLLFYITTISEKHLSVSRNKNGRLLLAFVENTWPGFPCQAEGVTSKLSLANSGSNLCLVTEGWAREQGGGSPGRGWIGVLGWQGRAGYSGRVLPLKTDNKGDRPTGNIYKDCTVVKYQTITLYFTSSTLFAIIIISPFHHFSTLLSSSYIIPSHIPNTHAHLISLSQHYLSLSYLLRSFSCLWWRTELIPESPLNQLRNRSHLRREKHLHWWFPRLCWMWRRCRSFVISVQILFVLLKNSWRILFHIKQKRKKK